MLTQAMLAGVERSLALAISRDPLTAKRLGALEGKVIQICASAPAWQVYVLPREGAIDLQQHCEIEPACRVKAPTRLLAQLAVSSQRQSLLQDPEVILSGDTQVLVSLQNIVADLRLDGEAELARWFGPVAGHAMANVLRTGRDWGKQTHENLTQSLGDYLTEEVRQLVGQPEARAAADELHALRLQLDRLDARVSRLENPDPDAPDA